MADQTSSPDSSTRWIETARGVLRYSELAPLLAERVLRVQERIEIDDYAGQTLNEELVCLLHRDFCGDLVPEWAGQWRKINVQVGAHEPPPPHLIPLQMREYMLDLQTRLENSLVEEHLIETLAFAEGRLLFIHPFADFNGRLTRLWLWELLRRLKLPPVNLIPSEAPSTCDYLKALAAADRQDFHPLINLWKKRLAGK